LIDAQEISMGNFINCSSHHNNKGGGGGGGDHIYTFGQKQTNKQTNKQLVHHVLNLAFCYRFNHQTKNFPFLDLELFH
jgi:hypothetical protein